MEGTSIVMQRANYVKRLKKVMNWLKQETCYILGSDVDHLTYRDYKIMR
jgi:hypothetical protein